MKKALFILLLLYYCVPKIDLFFIPGSVTGFRIQDIIAALIFIVLFDTKVKVKNILLLSFFILHSVYSISAWGNFQSVLGLIRFIEYYAIALGLYFLVQHELYPKFIKVLFVFIGILSVLQFLLLVPNIDPGRGIILSREFAGPFGTPAELSYFVVTSLFLLNIVSDRVSSYFLIAGAVLFNGVKAVALGFIVIYWNFLRKLNVFLGLFLCGIVIGFLYYRIEDIYAGIEFLGVLADNITTTNVGFEDLKDGGTISLESSTTLSYRIGKWGNTLSVMYQYPLGTIFGFGIYSQGGALDGGILRFAYEFGLIWFFIVIFTLRNLSLSFLLFILSINLLFDAYMSSLTMPLLIATYLFLADKNRYKDDDESQI